MAFGGAQYFRRREDCVARTTPADSPHRQFTIYCVKCDSYMVRVIAGYNEESGSVQIVLRCGQCGNAECVANA